MSKTIKIGKRTFRVTSMRINLVGTKGKAFSIGIKDDTTWVQPNVGTDYPTELEALAFRLPTVLRSLQEQ